MSLIYRGQNAQPSMTTETVEIGVKGTFLGRSFPIRNAQQLNPPMYKQLKYRGTAY